MTYEQKITLKKLLPWAGIFLSVATVLWKIEANHTASVVAQADLVKRVQAIEERLQEMNSYRLQRNVDYKEMDGRIDELSTEIKILKTRLDDCRNCK